MKRFLMMALALAAPMALSACGPGTPPPTTAGSIPVTVANAKNVTATAIDLSFRALDVTRAGVDAMVALKRIKPGSPTALAIASGLEGTDYWLREASRLQRQGADAAAAFDQASALYANIAKLISSTGGINGGSK